MIRKLLLTLLISSILILLWGIWILTLTTSGLKLDLAIVAKMVPGTLTIKHIQGSLLRGCNFTDIQYRLPDGSVEANISSLSLSWQGSHSTIKGYWTFTINDLSRFSSVIKGGAEGHGGIHGTLFTPALTGTMIGNNIWIAEQNIGNPTAHAMLSLRSNLTLSGYAELNTRLESLPPFTSQWIKQPEGLLQLDFKLGGSIMNPSFSGHGRLIDTGFRIPASGIQLQHVNLDAILKSNGHITFTGQFTSGPGAGTISGNIADETVSLLLQGEHLQVANLRHWKVSTSPDIHLKITSHMLEATGSILVPKALITTGVINNTITLPDDIVIISSADSSPSLPFLTFLNMDIRLGDDIQIATENLKAKLKGQLHLHQLPNGPITATGELRVEQGNNTFKAYGQTLNILNGRLYFAGGPVANPGLAIRAGKTIQRINLSSGTSSFTGSTGLQSIYTGREMLTVGVNVSGTLNDPNLTLFSDPAMNQADILSYLIFGYPRSDISGQQTSVLLTALSALNPSNSIPSGTDITDLLQKKLGITELNLETTQFFNPATSSTVSTTALVIGRKISDKLSLHYSVSLFYPISILNLRYQINKYWALQSENSTVDNGVDLLFRIESD